MITAPESSPSPASDARSELTRAALANAFVQVARIANPILFVVVARTYGASDLGTFATAQAIVFVLVRLALFGLDRALAALVPRAEAGSREVGLFEAMKRASRIGGALAIALAASTLAFGAGPRAVYVVAALSILPVLALDMLAQTLVGFRRLAPALVVRELVVPISASLLALALHPSGPGASGLAIGQLVATLLGLAIAAREVQRALHETGVRPDGRLSRSQRSRAVVLGVADTATTALVRLDVPFVAFFLGAAEAGVFAAVAQIVNTVRSIATNFDGITTAVVSRGATRGERGSTHAPTIEEALSSAIVLVAVTELPIVAFVLVFGSDLLAFFGAGFERGATAATIATLGVAIQGVLGLAGPAAVGLGRVRAYGAIAVVALLVELVLLVVLVPPLGLAGAGLAVALTAVFHGALVFASLHRAVGGFSLGRRAHVALVVLFAACAVAAVVAVRGVRLGSGLALGV